MDKKNSSDIVNLENCTIYLHILGKRIYHISCEEFDRLNGLPSGRIIELALTGPSGEVVETIKVYYRRHRDGELHIFAVGLLP